MKKPSITLTLNIRVQYLSTVESVLSFYRDPELTFYLKRFESFETLCSFLQISKKKRNNFVVYSMLCNYFFFTLQHTWFTIVVLFKFFFNFLKN